MKKASRILLLILSGFLALTAIPGGIALILGFQTPPVALLSGSPFNSFLFPGIALATIVGGSAAFAFVLMLQNSNYARYALFGMACIILVFEAVEIIVIGSPEGVARNLQIVYIVLGVFTVIALAGYQYNQPKQ